MPPEFAIIAGMYRLPADQLRPLREAVQGWVDAVDALMRDAYRIAKGGEDDPALLARLNADVEAARQRCERETARLPAPPEDDKKGG